MSRNSILGLGGLQQNLSTIFMAAALVVAVSQVQAAENSIKTAKDAKELLYPLEVALKQAAKIPDEAQRLKAQQAASTAIFQAQQKLTTLFGAGAEGAISFAHRGKNYTVQIDADKGMLRLTRNGFVLDATPSLVEPIHEAVMTGVKVVNVDQERNMTSVATGMKLPLSHPKAKSYYQHLFSGAGYRSEHDVNPAVITQAMNEICRPVVDRLNADLSAAMASVPAPNQ